MNKNKGAVSMGQVGVVVLLLAIVAGGAYYFGKSSVAKPEVKQEAKEEVKEVEVAESENKKVETEDTACQGMGCNNNSDEKNPPVLAVDKNLIKQTACGVSLLKASNWSVISNTNSEIVLDITPAPGQTVGPGGHPLGTSGIKIKCILGNTITDTDAKFGNITYYYNSGTKKWMVNTPNEEYAGINPAVEATPLFTVDGMPVFKGTGRWATYIVAVSPNSILSLNEGDTEGGSTKSLTDLVKTIKKL